MKKKRIIIISIVLFVALTAAAITGIVIFNNQPGRKVIKFATARGAINPEIIEVYDLTDDEIDDTFNGIKDKFSFETYTYENNFPKSTRYKIKSDNYPDYYVYSIKCHAGEYNKPDKTIVVNSFTDDLLQTLFDKNFVKRYEKFKPDSYYKYKLTFRKEAEIEEVNEILKELYYFVEDNNIKPVKLPYHVCLRDDRYFTLYAIPSRGNPPFFAGTSINEDDFERDLDYVLYSVTLELDDYDIIDGLFYRKTENIEQ